MTYPTEQWKCWDNAKKTTAKQKEDPQTIKQRGGVLVLGSDGHDEFLKYFDDLDYTYIRGEPYGAQVALNHELAQACCEEGICR